MPQVELLTNTSTDRIWEWLQQVPDPEIPVISLVELGVIRDVTWEGATLVIAVTPTYSGCPATAVINLDIENALRANGIEKLEIRRQLAPPWTTDWITDQGRQNLKKYGIAPPVDGTAACGDGNQTRAVVHCPRCESVDTECISQFGSTPCKSSYRCKSCLEPFDYFKCI